MLKSVLNECLLESAIAIHFQDFSSRLAFILICLLIRNKFATTFYIYVVYINHSSPVYIHSPTPIIYSVFKCPSAWPVASTLLAAFCSVLHFRPRPSLQGAQRCSLYASHTANRRFIGGRYINATHIILAAIKTMLYRRCGLRTTLISTSTCWGTLNCRYSKYRSRPADCFYTNMHGSICILYVV